MVEGLPNKFKTLSSNPNTTKHKSQLTKQTNRLKTKAKRARGTAQVVEHWPHKNEVLSSVPNTAKKPKTNKKTPRNVILITP
jgi:hypothetical protein